MVDHCSFFLYGKWLVSMFVYQFHAFPNVVPSAVHNVSSPDAMEHLSSTPLPFHQWLHPMKAMLPLVAVAEVSGLQVFFTHSYDDKP